MFKPVVEMMWNLCAFHIIFHPTEEEKRSVLFLLCFMFIFQLNQKNTDEMLVLKRMTANFLE